MFGKRETINYLGKGQTVNYPGLKAGACELPLAKALVDKGANGEKLMQKLAERDTYTPTDIPHVRSNCGPWLKSPEGRGCATDSKTSVMRLLLPENRQGRT